MVNFSIQAIRIRGADYFLTVKNLFMKKTMLLFSSLLILTLVSCKKNIDFQQLKVQLVDATDNTVITENSTWSLLIHYDNAFQTYHDGGVSSTNGDGVLIYNLTNLYDPVSYFELISDMSSFFFQKYYWNDNLSFPGSAINTMQTQKFYPKATIKCIINVNNPVYFGKPFYIDLEDPEGQKITLNDLGTGNYIPVLTNSQYIIHLNSAGNYTNTLKWHINDNDPYNIIKAYCNKYEEKELVINLN